MWISDSNYAFRIDTTNKVGDYGFCFLSNSKLDLRGRWSISFDTLRFEWLYSLNVNNEFLPQSDPYNFKILSSNDSTLILQPFSDFSISFLNNRSTVKFIRQAKAIDTSIHLQKIIFHPIGYCGYIDNSIYHLQIDNNKQANLFAEYVCRIDTNRIREDTKKEGYFSGTLSDTTSSTIISAIQTSNIKTAVLDKEGHRGNIATLTVYFNNDRRDFEGMLPLILENLYHILYDICENGELHKTNRKFTIGR